jgi:hypothetical protein
VVVGWGALEGVGEEGIVMSLSARRGPLSQPVTTGMKVVLRSEAESFYNPIHADTRLRIQRRASSPGPARR